MLEEKVKTGVDGLDEMLSGGIPQGHILAILGSCGTGKTTLTLQFIWKGLQLGEKVIFISLEEDEDSIKKNAASYGWDLQPYLENQSLKLIKLEPSDAKNTVLRVKSELPQFIRESGSKRVVLDSVSLLSMMFDNDTEKRTNLFALCQQIKDTGATAIFTAEVNDENPNVSRDGLIEYVADGVVLLKSSDTADASELQLSLRVIKMRRSRHSRKIKPYNITSKGIEVHSEAEVF